MYALVKQHSGSVKVLRQTETTTTVEINPTPFGSPSQKDLHGEWFHDETYFGDDIVQTKFGLYEHLLNDQVNPAMKEMGKKAQILGPATLVRKDDAGRWFELEIQRSLEYHDYLVDMIGKGLMGASTQVFANGRESVEDPKSKLFGKIDIWIENEVSLTPTPANPKTIRLINETIKAHQMPPIFLAKGEALLEVDEDLVTLMETDEDFNLADELDSIMNGGSDTPPPADEPLLSDEETAALNNLDDEVKAAFTAIVRTEVTEIVKAYMDVRIDVYGNDLKEISDHVAQMMAGIEGQTEDAKQLRRSVLEVQKGFATFVRWMKNIKIKEVGEAWGDMSEWERELMEELDDDSPSQKRFESAVPRGAPGTRD